MIECSSSEITHILRDWSNGDENAVERLIPFVYDELKRQARFLMSKERAEHTLQPTALVHEAFIRISRQSGIEWENSRHFYRLISRLMRQILVDYSRRRNTAKRGDNFLTLSLTDLDIPVENRMDSILLINTVLERLAEIDDRQAQLVEMKFFGGLSNDEIAEALGISLRTTVREWNLARLWLLREINRIVRM